MNLFRLSKLVVNGLRVAWNKHSSKLNTIQELKKFLI